MRRYQRLMSNRASRRPIIPNKSPVLGVILVRLQQDNRWGVFLHVPWQGLTSSGLSINLKKIGFSSKSSFSVLPVRCTDQLQSGLIAFVLNSYTALTRYFLTFVLLFFFAFTSQKEIIPLNLSSCSLDPILAPTVYLWPSWGPQDPPALLKNGKGNILTEEATKQARN